MFLLIKIDVPLSSYTTLKFYYKILSVLSFILVRNKGRKNLFPVPFPHLIKSGFVRSGI